MTRHLHATASPLNAFGTKVYAELVALPLPLPPARSRSGQTFPAYPAPMLLSSQSPKATQPTRLGAHQARWVHKGPGVARGTDVCQNWTVPGHRYGDGREGRCKWCWLTGYIFDTFNELIQTFHTRKDSPCYCCCALVSAYVPEACAGQGGDPAIRRTRGQGRRHTALHPSPPPFLGQNGLDAYSVAAICARWHSVPAHLRGGSQQPAQSAATALHRPGCGGRGDGVFQVGDGRPEAVAESPWKHPESCRGRDLWGSSPG